MVAYWSLSLMRSGCCERVEVEEVVFFQKARFSKSINCLEINLLATARLQVCQFTTVQKVVAL